MNMNNYQKYIAMKNKSIIGLVAAVFTLTLNTSCEDMLDVDSNRVVYEKDHTLSSTADSVYTTNGILQSLQQIADRYILLGELRGDLVDVNEMTQTSLRNIAEFKFDTNNEYLDPTDYYAVINNCNYLLEKMDTTHKKNGKPLMLDEYAGALSIRAWTYMQLAINYGKIPFYTKPLTKVADAEDVLNDQAQWLDIVGVADALIPELEEHVDTDMPAWANATTIPTKNLFPPIKLLLGDLYLWKGDYAQASFYFLDYLANRNDNQEENYRKSLATGRTYEFEGYMANIGRKLTYSVVNKKLDTEPTASNNWQSYRSFSSTQGENLCAISLSYSLEEGTISNVGSLFYSSNATHQLNPSAYWRELNNQQNYYRQTDNIEAFGELAYTEYVSAGDARGKFYYNTNNSYMLNGTEYIPFTKFGSSIGFINLYRRSIVYLRAAEALNCYAAEEYAKGDSVSKKHAGEHATIAFNLLKDAYLSFFEINKHTLDPAYSNTPEYRLKLNNDTAEFVIFEKELRQELFQGVHARGCGDVHLDTIRYTLKPEAIAEYLGTSQITFADTITYVEERILDELALEAAFEGNRFGDLIRFAERANDPNILIERVANRSGVLNQDIYNKLQEKSNWYLPLPEK